MGKIARIALAISAGVIFFSCAAVGLAQEDSCVNRTVQVGVFNSDDEPVHDFNVEQFHARMGGKPVAIVAANPDSGHHRLFILLDEGLATGDVARRRTEIAMAEGLISWLPSDMLVSLLTFGIAPERHVDDRLSVSKALASMEARPMGSNGEATSASALVAALGWFGPRQRGDEFLLITDVVGEIPRSIPGHEPEDLEQQVAAAGVRVFGFLPISDDQNARPKKQSPEAPHAVQNLIAETGGDYLLFASTAGKSGELTPEDRSKLAVAARGFAQELTDSYSVQIRLPQPIKATTEWKLEVSGGEHLRILYPRRLAGCQ